MFGVASPIPRALRFVALASVVACAAMVTHRPSAPQGGRDGAQLRLEFVVGNEHVEPDEGADPFVSAERRIADCYRASLPPVADPDLYDGTLHVAVHIGPDGYGQDVRVRGTPTTLDAFAPCFEAALKAEFYEIPSGQPAGYLGVYDLQVGPDAPKRRYRTPPPTQRVHPQIIGAFESKEASGYLFLLLRRDPIERCYDAFVERKRVGGNVSVRWSMARDGRVKARAKASKWRLRPVAKCIEAAVASWEVPSSLVGPREDFQVRYDLSPDPAPRPRPQARAPGRG
ncbi:MAG: hypothetical protein AAGA54_36755 [Myxococcota bacterium]